MKLDKAFLHSKLARRIFWLFVLCALIPITVLALVSIHDVTAQFNEQSHSQLHQASKEEAMIVYERLVFLETNLKLIAAAIHSGVPADPKSPADRTNAPFANLSTRLRGIELAYPEGRRETLFGKMHSPIAFSQEEMKVLGSGKSVLSTIACGKAETCIFLSRQVEEGNPGKGILVSQINPSYLWDEGSLSSETSLCVLNELGRPMFCSGEAPEFFLAQVTHSFSGEFQWKLHGREFMASYWNLPLETSFHVPHWTIVTSRAKADVVAPLLRFKTSFTLVYLLAFWIVLLLSLVQIRRNLVPLAKLKEGTSKIAAGDFCTRVNVDSDDEFEDVATSFNFMAGRIEKQLRSQQMVSDISRAILSSLDFENIVKTLASRLGDVIAVDIVGVTSFESENSSSTTLTQIYSPDPESPKLQVTLEVSAEEKKQINLKPYRFFMLTDELPSYLKPLTVSGMKRFLVIPIVVENKLVALLSLGTRSELAWSEEERQQAREIADQLAVALANSRLVGQLEQLQWGTLTALARAIDAKSPWTLGHSERVTDLAVRIATKMGLPNKELGIIRRGGLLHDIGKIGIPVSILDKQGKLTKEEMEIMREHVNIGARILEPVPGLSDSMPIVLQHHEWINGGGYPNGLAGDQITLHARIFAVADCFDALVSDRPYRPGMTTDRAAQIIQEGVGKQFDPAVFDVFRNLVLPKEVVSECGELSEAMMKAF